MKSSNVEKIVCEYYDNNIQHNYDTNSLLNNLRPAISHKCTDIKTKANSPVESIILVIFEVIAFLIGLSLLFPELLYYIDELSEPVVLMAIIGVVLLGIYLTVNQLTLKYILNHK